MRIKAGCVNWRVIRMFWNTFSSIKTVKRSTITGRKPYLARYYIGADTREELDNVTESFFKQAYVAAQDGDRIDLPFVLERD